MNFLLRQMFRLEVVKKFATDFFLTATAPSPLIRLYKTMGILNFRTPEISGERYALECISRFYQNFFPREKLILFDVGANVGEYSRLLQSHFTSAQIHAFEPNPYLSMYLKKISGIQVHMTGLGSKKDSLYLYMRKDHEGIQLASVHKEVFSDIHKEHHLEKTLVPINSIDRFVRSHNLKKIHFLKIDTEGHELEVLKGATQLLKRRGVDFIQFEFNSMNVISRVFLKDFYDLLPGYALFRLHSRALIPLYEYSPINEIFQFQNFLAVHSKHLKAFSTTFHV